MENGYVKLHRVFKHWGWKDSPKHVAVFIDLLLNAQWRESNYRGKSLLPGQLSTSYGAISKRSGVSIRSVRTVIKDLISTREVTHQGLRDCSIITILNWDKYQMTDKVIDNQVTSKRQASDNLQERKKERKKENNILVCEVVEFLNEQADKSYKPNGKLTRSKIEARLNEGYTVQDCKKVITHMVKEWRGSEMAKYLRPETLFGNKFEGYLQDADDEAKHNAQLLKVLDGV